MNAENQNPQVVRKVLKELEKLSTESLEGIKVITNDTNLLDIQAIIDGPGEKSSFQVHF
jgi:ubiquitin-conjugating enzyme E2 S